MHDSTSCTTDSLTLRVRYCNRDIENKTAELSQRRPRDAPNIWVH